MFSAFNGKSSLNGTASRYPIHSVTEVLEKKPEGLDLYSRFALAGALGCAITHGALTPVDVVKTRIQLEPEVYNKVSNQQRRDQTQRKTFLKKDGEIRETLVVGNSNNQISFKERKERK